MGWGIRVDTTNRSEGLKPDIYLYITLNSNVMLDKVKRVVLSIYYFTFRLL